MRDLPELRPGTAWVFRPTKAGIRFDAQKSSGWDFVSQDDITGFVQDARAMLRLLARLDMPRSWFRAWLALLSMQDHERSWALRITHEELSRACGIPRSKLSEPLMYFDSIGWTRKIKRAVLQLNPWLTSCGSVYQAEAQAEWIAAGGPDFMLPSSDHPARWRAERKLAAAPDAQVLTLPLSLPDLGQQTFDMTLEGPTSCEVPAAGVAADATMAALGVQPTPVTRERRHSRPKPLSKRIRAAIDELGVEAPTHRIHEWLIANGGGDVNPLTFKSALSRARNERRNAS